MVEKSLLIEDRSCRWHDIEIMGRLNFSADLATTTMGIMPHDSVGGALDTALALDIPFWPQLPRVSYSEDMYVQAMENFPGVVIDRENLRIHVDSTKFMEDLPDYLEKESSPDLFRLTEESSVVYRKFLERDLSGYKAIRGQMMSPVSVGLTIVDENGKPIAYNDDMREVLFPFLQKKANIQYQELSRKNPNAFVWFDDPGLQYIFSALSGYDSVKAKSELAGFLNGVEGPRGIHLCGNPDWDFLFTLPLEIVSFNAYAYGDVVCTYESVRRFLEQGNIISWGIVPTFAEEFQKEDVASLTKKLRGMWKVLEEGGISPTLIRKNSMIATATCHLMNADKEATVDSACRLLKGISEAVAEHAG
jgi:hypothetical protein